MGLSLPHLIVVLAVALLLFGTKRLRNIGSDLGEAVRGFKKAMHEEETPKLDQTKPDTSINDDSKA